MVCLVTGRRTRPNLVVGLTGGAGSGKSTVAALFGELGVTTIDADVLARAAVERGQPALESIVREFGPDVLEPSGALDRANMREIVFSDPGRRRRLEAILHPRIRAAMHERLRELRDPYCLLCIPLLFETAQVDMVDRVLVVDVPEALQIERIRRRDDSSRATIEGMLAAQIGREARRARADDVIDNSGDLDALRRQVASLHERYLELAVGGLRVGGK